MAYLSKAMAGLLIGAVMLAPTLAQAQDQVMPSRGGERPSGGQRGGADRGGADRSGAVAPTREQVARTRSPERERPAERVERPAPVAAIRGDTGRDDNRGTYRRGDDTRQRDATRDTGRNGNRDRDGDNRKKDDRNQRWSTDRHDWNRSTDDRRGNARADWDRNGRDRSGWDRDGDRRGNDRWDRSWRNDRRYSWQDYRRSNRSVYRQPRYVAPRHGYGYGYRRWSPGYRFDSWYYSSNYWINDPWQYRLPPAYGGYRWVRYYDDAVLVDTYTGEIVDIIYSFFY